MSVRSVFLQEFERFSSEYLQSCDIDTGIHDFKAYLIISKVGLLLKTNRREGVGELLGLEDCLPGGEWNGGSFV